MKDLLSSSVTVFGTLLGFFALFSLPIHLALSLNIFLHASVAWCGIVIRRISFLPWLMLASYSLICIGYFGFKMKNMLTYTGTVVYAVLGVFAIVTLIKGGNFSELTVGKETESLDRKVNRNQSIGWIFVASLSGFLSHVLRPNLSYIYVPAMIVLAYSIGVRVWRRHGF